VIALRTFVYPDPDVKFPAAGWLTLGSRIALDERAVETRGTRFGLLAGDSGAVISDHVAPLDSPYEADFVSVAERFVETPYLWGGRTSLGLDCSALVQLALMAAGVSCPRDTDVQEGALGHALEGGLDARRARGDLVFWKGHVGILTDADHMVHASGHHMRVVVEPLAEAVARLARSGLEPTAIKRL
jgi:cell wall-associated NlpC family hydrolase